MSDPKFTFVNYIYNNIDVGFSAKPTFADIDGDGDLDAFVGEKYGFTVFFRNTGTASTPAFSNGINNAFGLSNIGSWANPTLVDIDGDGDLDAFVGRYTGNTSFFRNIGTAYNPAFATALNNPFGLAKVGYGASPSFVDIDNDGDLDAFLGNSIGDTWFFRNTGTVSNPLFATPSLNPFGLTKQFGRIDPAFVDIDGDGDLDAFIGDGNGYSIFFRNTGTLSSPAFAAPQKWPLPFGFGKEHGNASPTFADIDSDGDIDAFIGNELGTTAFYMNTSTPGVRIIQSGGASAVTEGGAADTYTIVLMSPPTATVTIALDDTNQQISSGTPYYFSTANWYIPQTIVVTAVDDTTGEGKHTGVIKHTVSSTDTLYNNIAVDSVNISISDNDLPASDPIFSFFSTNPFGLYSVGSYAKPALIDIDSDGDLDAFVGNINGSGNILFFKNTGTASNPAFAAPLTNPFGLSSTGYAPSPVFIDIDGDGDLDAFVGNGSGNMLFFKNTGTASSPGFASATTNSFGLSDVGGYASPVFVDIDSDGDLDAFVGNGSGEMLFFKNTGTINSPAFATASNNPFGLADVGYGASPSLVDIDNDGDLDALIGNNVGNTLFFRNTGTASNPVFAAPSTNPFGLSNVVWYANPVFVDIDSDGDLDALIGDSSGNTLFYKNTLLEPAGVTIIQSSGSTTVTEGGIADTYTIVLNRAPTADVTITLDDTNQQVSSNVNTLTFNSANWNIAQTVTVTAVNDTVGEGSHTGVIKSTVSSTDARYNNLAVDSVVIAITDNDLPAADPVFGISLLDPFGFSFTYVTKPRVPSFVDIDADGDLDAFVGDGSGETYFSRNTGTSSNPAFFTGDFLSNRTPFGLTDVGGSSKPTFVDIDADGDLDAFVGNQDGNTVFFKNTGTASNPAFADPLTNPFGLSDVWFFASPTFVDIDADGDLDAFLGQGDGKTSFFRNTGTSSNPAFDAAITHPFGLYKIGHETVGQSFVDIDGDGDLDAFIGVDDSYNTLFFRNIGTSSNPAFDAAITHPFGLHKGSAGILVLNNVGEPSFVDMDADGDLDAFTVDASRNLFFQKNTLIDNEVNTAPVLISPLINEAVQYGTLGWSYNTSTSFSDADSGDSLSYSATLSNGNPLPTWLQINSGSGVLTGAPLLSDRGTYPLTVQATDTHGASAIAPLTVAVTLFNAGQLLVSTSGNDILAGTTANDTVTYGLATAAVTVSLAATAQQNTVGAGLDTLTNIDNVIGSNFNDRLTGNTKNNALDGGAGNDKLNGGGGADTMFGGLGSDSFTVNHSGDTVTEFLNEGTDKISSSVTYTLPANVENLTLTGSSAINGTGNSQANTVTGNTGNNTLTGSGGNDKLDGKTGTNTLTGGAGKDTFKFTTAGHIDTITDFIAVDDTIQLENAVFTSLTATGTLTVDKFRIGAQALDANDFVIYNNSTGVLLYDADGNGAGAAMQIAIVGTGLSMTNADFVVI